MYLNLIQIAESLGVSESMVTEWVRREGMPHVHDRGRILFEQAQVLEWAARRGLAANTGFLSEAAPGSPLSLATLLRRGGIWRHVPPTGLSDVLQRVVHRMPGLPAAVRDLLCQRMASPNGVTIAPVGGGYALPHPEMRVSLGEQSALTALIFLDAPLPGTKTPDGIPISRLLFFISPTPRMHVNMLGLLAKTIASGTMDRIDPALDDDAILRGIDQDDPSAQGDAR
jgi:PTS system nitrogen regulatory IIA component